ncbi:hypothetical protein [Paenibacillus alvei]|uniref:Uncharacterized protein n=1 Tax=Paenibacillus alvei TaxID=44250 RepID=A0A383RB39_PAEAL|nr:hypothetical protein [Paenibacillus alvei]SYX84013.1 conserved protein of unknown function [Paenibacillus alvei]
MAKQLQEKVGLIAQAEAEYEAIVEEVRGYCQNARQLREQADELRQSGSTDPQVATEVRKLLEQAEYFEQLANEKDGHPRLETIRHLEGLQWEATALKGTIQQNKSVLARQDIELEEAEREAVLLVQRAKEQIQETEQLLESQRAKLTELEGNRVE